MVNPEKTPPLPARRNKNNNNHINSTNTYAPLDSDNDTMVPNWDHEDSLNTENPTDKDVKNAYDIIDAPDTTINDELLIQIYQIRVNDNPTDSPRQRKALTVIGKSRQSSIISKFLAEEGFSNFDYSSSMPVGLNNIGNTCYLNSLLQYYFTIQELREAVLQTDTYEKEEFDQDWENKIIGGRRVTKNE
ncbi:1528_t:CDS:2, partial [Ambispora leptoticha]